MDSFTMGPREVVTNGEFTSNIDSWTTISGSGSAAYTSAGNGRLRLNDSAAHQSIDTTVNKTYKIQVRVLDTNSVGAALKVQVGTAAEGTQNLNTTLTVTDFGEGAVLDTTFTATAQFNTSNTAQADYFTSFGVLSESEFGIITSWNNSSEAAAWYMPLVTPLTSGGVRVTRATTASAYQGVFTLFLMRF